MGMAVIALAGALLSPQDLAVTVTAPAIAVMQSLDLGALSNVATGLGGPAISTQTLNATTSNVALTLSGQGMVRTGDVVFDRSAVASGIQANVLDTGLGSTGQALVSITGDLSFAAAKP